MENQRKGLRLSQQELVTTLWMPSDSLPEEPSGERTASMP